MGYHPLYDLNVDVALGGAGDFGRELVELLEVIVKHKLTLIGWQTSGPGGGNPNVTVRGTRKQITAWINEYYDPDDEEYMVDPETRSDADVWLNIVAAFNPTFVA